MIAQRIKELRFTNDLTQKDLAIYLGLTPKMISFYELGQRVPPSDIILKLADRFNVTTDYLLGRNNSIRSTKNLSSEREKLLKNFEAFDDDIKEAQQYLNYRKSLREKSEDAATTASCFMSRGPCNWPK